MRKLTLQRKKTFVACACAVYLYVSCPESEASARLGGVPCKNVGKIKNGQTVTIEIPDEAVRFFVAYSRTLPESYHTYCTIPAGTEDITLGTKPKFSPFEGNPFSIYAVENK